jgi:hypothetical protein
MYANSIPGLECFGRDFYCAYALRLRTPDVREGKLRTKSGLILMLQTLKNFRGLLFYMCFPDKFFSSFPALTHISFST